MISSLFYWSIPWVHEGTCFKEYIPSSQSQLYTSNKKYLDPFNLSVHKNILNGVHPLETSCMLICSLPYFHWQKSTKARVYSLCFPLVKQKQPVNRFRNTATAPSFVGVISVCSCYGMIPKVQHLVQVSSDSGSLQYYRQYGHNDKTKVWKVPHIDLRKWCYDICYSKMFLSSPNDRDVQNVVIVS